MDERVVLRAPFDGYLWPHTHADGVPAVFLVGDGGMIYHYEGGDSPYCDGYVHAGDEMGAAMPGAVSILIRPSERTTFLCAAHTKAP